jgi:flagellar assembly factor FliW
MSDAPILLNIEEITFPEGLIGLAELKHFNLQQSADMIPIVLMHSAEEKGLSFIVSDPANWFPGYKFDISEAEMAQVKASKVDELMVLVIINVASDPFNITANMVSPLVINPASKLGIQLLLAGSPFMARQPLTLRTVGVYLKEGLLGIPEWKNFVLQIIDELMPVMLLASQDTPMVSFPVIDPWIIDQEYAPELSDEDKAYFGVQNTNELAWFVILNVQSEPFQVTANMLSPIVTTSNGEKARQVMLSRSPYQVAHPIKVFDAEKMKSMLK